MWTDNEIGLLTNITLEYIVNKRKAALVLSVVGELMHIHPDTVLLKTIKTGTIFVPLFHFFRRNKRHTERMTSNKRVKKKRFPVYAQQ